MDIPALSPECAGCGACSVVCPVSAIVMVPDSHGFRRPAVSGDCIGCGKCGAVCPVNAPVPKKAPLECRTVAAPNRRGCASGGVGWTLMRKALESGWKVAGAVRSGDDIHHVYTDSSEEAARTRNSKYAECRAEHVYGPVRDDLAAGGKVLFTGTPCLVAGRLAVPYDVVAVSGILDASIRGQDMA